MSNRGTQALRESEWQTSQRKDGYQDALHGRPERYSDQFYQRGVREGHARKAKEATTPKCQSTQALGWVKHCQYLASKIARDRLRVADPTRQEGVAWAVCGIHANVLAKRGFDITPL